MREAEKEAAARIPRIDAIVGEPLRNVNIFAGKDDPVARPDEEYPVWLRREVERPAKLDPYRFQKLGILPTRTELRLINKAKIRQSNEERSA